MDADRKAALSAGVLFITATAASIAGTALTSPVLNGTSYLTKVSSSSNQISGGALLQLIAAFASAGIAISLYPVLKRWSASLALGSVVFRAIEAVMYTAGVVSLLSLVTLGRQFTGAAAADRPALQVVGDSMLAVQAQAGLAGVFAFCLGAVMYYYLFYQSRLIPRWLSGWGIVAIALMLVACVLALYSHSPITGYVILALPIAVQEMVLAVWLIAKGFDSAALESPPATTARVTPVTSG